MSVTPHIAITNQHLYTIHTICQYDVELYMPVWCWTIYSSLMLIKNAFFKNNVKLTSLYYQIFCYHNAIHELLLAKFIIFCNFPDKWKKIQGFSANGYSGERRVKTTTK